MQSLTKTSEHVKCGGAQHTYFLLKLIIITDDDFVKFLSDVYCFVIDISLVLKEYFSRNYEKYHFF